MAINTQSSRNVRRPLIKAAKGMVAMTFLGGCRLYPYWTGGDNGDGGGGSGGSGGDGSTSSSSGGGTAGAGVGGMGGMGGSAPTCSKTCGDAITNGDAVCTDSPASLQLYQALAACSCERAAMDPMPGCKDVCADNLCAGADPSADCGKCVQSGSCAMEFGACAGDI